MGRAVMTGDSSATGWWRRSTGDSCATGWWRRSVGHLRRLRIGLVVRRLRRGKTLISSALPATLLLGTCETLLLELPFESRLRRLPRRDGPPRAPPLHGTGSVARQHQPLAHEIMVIIDRVDRVARVARLAVRLLVVRGQG